jgi:hypothetical protein
MHKDMRHSGQKHDLRAQAYIALVFCCLGSASAADVQFTDMTDAIPERMGTFCRRWRGRL